MSYPNAWAADRARALRVLDISTLAPSGLPAVMPTARLTNRTGQAVEAYSRNLEHSATDRKHSNQRVDSYLHRLRRPGRAYWLPTTTPLPRGESVVPRPQRPS